LTRFATTFSLKKLFNFFAVFAASPLGFIILNQGTRAHSSRQDLPNPNNNPKKQRIKHNTKRDTTKITTRVMGEVMVSFRCKDW
jgi:uncharacterized membrane protein